MINDQNTHFSNCLSKSCMRLGSLIAVVMLFSGSLWSCGQKGNLVLLDAEKPPLEKPVKEKPAKKPEGTVRK